MVLEGLPIFKIIIIFFVGIIASLYGTLVGSASLFTIPTLLMLGVPPHSAIGTDRFGITGLCIAGWYQFNKKRLINYRVGITIAVPVVIGSFIGANIVLKVPETLLRILILGISLLSIVVFTVNPTKGLKERTSPPNKKEYIVGSTIGLLIGCYAGFYGALSGTFILYLLIFWFGQTFLQSAGTSKIATTFMNASAAIVFILNGVISFPLAIGQFAGCVIGSTVGSHYSEKIGNIWIKRIFIAIITLVTAKLILDTVNLKFKIF